MTNSILEQITFHRITFRNFMSYGNNITAVNFNDGGVTTIITGEDLDNTENGTVVNGIGKSTIINALVYALYDKVISKLTVNDLINNINNREMYVTLEYTSHLS